MKKLDILAAVLVIVGGLNWGLVALAEFDLVAALVGLDFGETNGLIRIVYGLVGLAAVYQIAQQAAIRRRWSTQTRHSPLRCPPQRRHLSARKRLPRSRASPRRRRSSRRCCRSSRRPVSPARCRSRVRIPSSHRRTPPSRS